MPTKRVIKQKQKQSVTVNISLAKERARASRAKKSKGKRSSGMMLPPPIYASPINNLIPAMYGAQGQQIQPKSTEELLKNFLSKAEPHWNTLGSAPKSTEEFIKSSSKTPIVSSLASFKSLGSGNPLPDYVSDSPDWVSELSTPSVISSYKSISTSSTKSPIVSSLASFKSLGSVPSSISLLGSVSPSLFSDLTEHSLNTQWEIYNTLVDIAEDIKKEQIQDFRSKKLSEQLKEQLKNKNIPRPFQNEERTYLKASEPDNESTAPKFSEKAPTSIYDTLEARRPDRRHPIRVQLDEEASVV